MAGESATESQIKIVEPPDYMWRFLKQRGLKAWALSRIDGDGIGSHYYAFAQSAVRAGYMLEHVPTRDCCEAAIGYDHQVHFTFTPKGKAWVEAKFVAQRLKGKL